MILSETIRALRSAEPPAERLDDIVVLLEERVALVGVATTPPRPCHFCNEGTVASPGDVRSPASRVCAACIRLLAPVAGK